MRAPKTKVVHMAKMVSSKGEVSPLCAPRPRALDLKKASAVWYQPEAVTCRKCRALMTPEFIAKRMAKPPTA
jgi:hypothetical protein